MRVGDRATDRAEIIAACARYECLWLSSQSLSGVLNFLTSPRVIRAFISLLRKVVSKDRCRSNNVVLIRLIQFLAETRFQALHQSVALRSRDAETTHVSILVGLLGNQSR